MKAKMKTIWKKIKCAVKECFNLLTNLITPILSALCILAEVLQLPTGVIKALKSAEYWCWNACGTADDIGRFIEEVDKAVEKITEGSGE